MFSKAGLKPELLGSVPEVKNLIQNPIDICYKLKTKDPALEQSLYSRSCGSLHIFTCKMKHHRCSVFMFLAAFSHQLWTIEGETSQLDRVHERVGGSRLSLPRL